MEGRECRRLAAVESPSVWRRAVHSKEKGRSAHSPNALDALEGQPGACGTGCHAPCIIKKGPRSETIGDGKEGEAKGCLRVVCSFPGLF